MDLCGEHGFKEIAYSTERGASCPACNQIEELTNDYEIKVDNLREELQDAQTRIDELEDELNSKEK